MKKFFITLLGLFIAFGAFAQSGTTGNLTWTLSGGTLTISGTGVMPDYATSTAPWNSYKSSITAAVVSEGVTSIGRAAFYFCNSLTSVTIGSDVTSIGVGAFRGCNSLASITIPSSVTSIGFDAFEYCNSLTSVTIPAGVTNIEEGAFAGCSALTAINVNAANGAYSSVDGILYDKTQTTLVQCPGAKSGAFTIPGSVTNIGTGAFFGCSGLTSVTIPNSVTSIGAYAFSGCSGLTSVTIPGSVTSIGEVPFGGCSALTAINVDASYGDTNGDGVINGSDAYDGAYVSVDGILYNKTQTTLIQCPGGKSGAVAIPGSVTSIGTYAFINCISLTSVTIGNGVTSIGDRAFLACSGLTKITVKNPTPPTLGISTFLNVDTATCVLEVPSGAKAAYKAANQWKDFRTINEVDFSTADYVLINGVLWATRNLDVGGGFVANPENYGALFQWGRKADGHESRASSITTTLATTDNPGHGNFIFATSFPNDWRSTPNNALWNAGTETTPVKAANDPSPTGYRVPTATELLALLDYYKVTNECTTLNGVNGRKFTDIATGKSIFLPAAGVRNFSTGAVEYAGNAGPYGHYWGSSSQAIGINPSCASDLSFICDGVVCSADCRDAGKSVRPVFVSATAVPSVPAESAVRVFPNPVKDELYINHLPTDHLPFIIFDLRSKQMINGQYQNGQSIHVSALPAGVYMIKVGDWRGKFVKK